MTGKTSLGAVKSLGDVESEGLESYTNSFDGEVFHFVGLFGTSTDKSVQSLGGIRMKTDCKNFGTVDKKTETDDTSPKETAKDKTNDSETSGGSSGAKEISGAELAGGDARVEEKEGGSSTLILIIGIVVLVIVIGAVVGIVVSKSKKGSSKTTVAPINHISLAEAEAMPDREDITPIDLEDDKDLTANDRNDTKGELKPTDHDDGSAFQTNEPKK